MKKNLLISVLFLLFLGTEKISAQTSKVKIESVGANYAAATPTVTFSVSWPAGSRNANEQSKLWVWIDYRPIKNNAAAGSWQRAKITEPPTYHSAGTPALEPGNNSGFWLQGSTDNSAFSSTLTVRVNVDLTGFDPQFNWCAYASDRPPHAAPVEGGYTLNGTPPFIIQTQRNNSGSTASISSSTYHNCIYGLTDATGAPGVVPPVPEITAFTSSATTLCAGQPATLTATLAAAGSFSYSFNNGATWGSSPTTVVTPTTSTTYILKAKHADGGCTVTAPTPIEITVHPMPDVALISASNWVAVDLNVAMTEIKYVTTAANGATVTGVPPGVSGTWTANTYTIGGTPTQFGTFPYTVTTTNAHGCINPSATGIIQVATGCVRSSYTLGTVGFANTDTYTRNGITISAPVTATGCQKTTYDGGTHPAPIKADCRDTPGYVANYLSWCMVMQWSDQLCPSPWRVPSETDLALFITGSTTQTQLPYSIAGSDGWEPMGMMHNQAQPYAVGSFVTNWTTGSFPGTDQSLMLMTTSNNTNIGTAARRHWGTPLRCVQDAP